MSFLDDDDTFTELAEEERRRHGRRGSSAPLVRLLLVLAGVVVVVLVSGLLVRNWLHTREITSYGTYMSQVADILKRSDETGRDLSKVLQNPGDATRKDVQTKLDKYSTTANTLTEEAKGLTTPNDLLEAQQWFVATLQLRSRGLQNLKPSLMNALEVQDIEVSSETVARAMLMLVLSDVAYEEFFMTRASDVLKERSIEGVSVASTDFITDSSLASTTTIKEILSTLKSSQNLQSVHGVALKEVRAMPADKAIEADGTYNLASTSELQFVVTVENQGNMAEKDVPVEINLTSPTSAQPQIVTTKIAELKAKETKKVTISDINPTDYGEKALLTVTVGPVPDEKIKENNTLKAYVIFLL